MALYAIVEHTATSERLEFEYQSDFVNWAIELEFPQDWVFLPDNFVYDIFGDREVIEHLETWSIDLDEAGE